MQYQTIILEKSEGIATLILNRPSRFNAINTDMLGELQAAIQEVNQDDEVKVLIVTGAGPGFCTGVDIDIVRDMIERPSWVETPLRELRVKLPSSCHLEAKYSVCLINP